MAANFLAVAEDAQGTSYAAGNLPLQSGRPPLRTIISVAQATVLDSNKLSDAVDATNAKPQFTSDGVVTDDQSDPHPCGSAASLPDKAFRTVWYSTNRPSPDLLTVTTEGSRYDTVLSVFAGSASDSNFVACNDDIVAPSVGNGGEVQSEVTFQATKNVTYLLYGRRVCEYGL